MDAELFQNGDVDYRSHEYLSKARWISYWYQIKESNQAMANSSILEVGPGNNLVKNVLSGIGHRVKTVDIDRRTKPDYLADIRQISRVVREKFDTVLCCEIFEHIPFEDFEITLHDILEISREHLIATIPYSTKGTFTPHFTIKLFPFMKPFRWLRIFPIFTKDHVPTSHINGHQWEIGKRGFPLKRIQESFRAAGWSIKKQYPIFENPYHYMFVCTKKIYNNQENFVFASQTNYMVYGSINWLDGLEKLLAPFLREMQSKHTAGYVRYTLSGDLFFNERNANLAGSIFALKLYAMLGETDIHIIQPIVDRVLTFQNVDGAFCDPFIARKRIVRHILSNLKRRDFHDFGNRGYIRAETRQAYSALFLHGLLPKNIATYAPTEPDKIRHFLFHLDWSRPWGAGSHFSHLMFFLSLLRLNGRLDSQHFMKAHSAAIEFISSLQHETDGAWYTGNPSHRQKVNGAMKIVMGLAVDGTPFKYPEQLIDLCLRELPNGKANACDQINQMLVLRYADELCQHSYRRSGIEQFCLDTLNVWREYYYPEFGGFSFYKHRANDRYYGAKVSRGIDEPDIHGTVLFVWGLSAMNKILHLPELEFLHEIKT